MKKILFAIAIAGLLIIASCKKNNSSVGSWTFEGTSYTATGAGFSTVVNTNYSMLTATTSSTTNPGTLGITFLYQPYTSGTYKIVNYTTTLDSNQLFVEFTNANNNIAYFSTGNDNVNAKVTVSSSGKVSVSLPPTYLEDYSNPVPDSAQISGSITQQ